MPRRLPTLPNDYAFPWDHDDQTAGLSIREYFALHLFAGTLAGSPEGMTFESGEAYGRRLAAWSVQCAEYLIDALNAPPAAAIVREDDGQPE